MPPILISVGVTPGASPAKADVISAALSAHATVSALNIEPSSTLSIGTARSLAAVPLVRCAATMLGRRRRNYSSIFELVKHDPYPKSTTNGRTARHISSILISIDTG